MNRQFISVILSFCLIIFSFNFVSCGNKKRVAAVAGGTVTLYEAGEDSIQLKAPVQLWHENNQCICVLYGYGYNDAEFVEKMNAQLYSKFGKYDEGGYVFSLVYPDDFKRGSKSYISLLKDYLEDKEMSGIVLIGAPEGTYKAIARMQDACDGKLNYPVMSLFSQDDVVAMEDSADFVLDKVQKSEINGLVHEDEQTFISAVPELLERCVWYSQISEAPYAKNAKLYEIVKRIGKGLKIGRYSDPETGLISINHFVLE